MDKHLQTPHKTSYSAFFEPRLAFPFKSFCVTSVGFVPLQENFFKVRPRFFCRTAATHIAIARDSFFLSRVFEDAALTAPIQRQNLPAIVRPYFFPAFRVNGISNKSGEEFLSAQYQKKGWISSV
jgi:hypothetical protein